MGGRLVQLTLDFDGTLTKRDTLHLVAEAGYQRQSSNRKPQQVPPWQDIVDAYMSDYETHTSTYKPDKPNRNTLLEETGWLNSLQSIETESVDRAVEAGIFDDVSKQNMEEAAAKALSSGNVELRPGWAELITTAYQNNSAVIPNHAEHLLLQIVSVNWSRWFIWSVLWKAAASLDGETSAEVLKNALNYVAIYANELESIKSETETLPSSMISPRGHAMVLRTANDKLRQLQSIPVPSKFQSNLLQVYVGDSTTDLECLLTADIGICIRDHNMSSGQKDLAATCERIGVVLKNLDEYRQAPRSTSTISELEEKKLEGHLVIYYAYGFDEVMQWMKDALRPLP